MVIIDFKADGLDVLSELAKDLKKLKANMSSSINSKIARIPGSSYKKVAFSSTVRNLPSAMEGTEEAMQDTDIVKDVVVSKGSSSYIRSYQGGKSDTVASIKKSFAQQNNGIALVFPSISPDLGAVFKPRSSDLEIKRDRRGLNRWSISLTESAIKRISKSLEANIHKVVTDEINRTLLGSAPVSGIEIDISAKLGVQAERIHIIPTSHVGADITSLVQEEVRSRMATSGRANVKLNNRTGSFISSIKDVIVSKKDVISYSFDKRRYGIHEKTDASGNPLTTTIRARNAPYLRFKNLKNGRWYRVRSVSVRARPVIKKSIRAVAYKKFRQRFKMVVR